MQQFFFNPGDATVHCVLGWWLIGEASSQSFHLGTLTVCVAERIKCCADGDQSGQLVGNMQKSFSF